MPPAASLRSSRFRDFTSVSTLVVALSTPFAASPVFAQETTAEAVFEEGAKLFEAGNYAAACPKLKSAVSLSPGEALGGKLLLAGCYEKIGRWASAWALYREIAPRAATSGQVARQDRAEAGRARVEPKLARLRIALGPGVAALPGLTLDRDGEVIPQEAWDIAIPVDPGVVVITAKATGKRAVSMRITVADAAATSTATIDRLEDETSPLPPAVAPPALQVGEPTAADADGNETVTTDEGGLTGLGIAGIVVGATGVVGLGVSALVAAGAKSSWDDAVAAEDAQAVDDARGTGNAATGVFVAGAVLTAAGATLLVIDLSRDPSQAPSARRFELRTSGLGAWARGTF